MFLTPYFIHRFIEVLRDVETIMHDVRFGDIFEDTLLERLPHIHRDRFDIFFLIL